MVPTYVNAYPVCELAFCDSDRYHVLVVPLRHENRCFISFLCLLVGALLYLDNKFTENVISSRVLLPKYIKAPMALKDGPLEPKISSFSIVHGMGLLLCLVIGLPLENSMDEPCPSKNVFITFSV